MHPHLDHCASNEQHASPVRKAETRLIRARSISSKGFDLMCMHYFLTGMAGCVEALKLGTAIPTVVCTILSCNNSPQI